MPINEAISALSDINWDSDTIEAELTRADIRKLLNRYINNEITESDVESWANAIECREDIGFETGQEELIKTIIFELANPLLTKNLTLETATTLNLRLL